MPYQIKEEDGKYVVYDTDTNKKQGSFEDRRGAMKRMRALYQDEAKHEGKPDRGSDDDDEEEDDE